ncbi:MAG: hypothetical protein HC892_01430 [Saprospiraceae bacterium]|nr:hypothetical protein [Saprospiraceae bacterium]
MKKLLMFLTILFIGCNPSKVILKNKDLAQKLVCEPTTINSTSSTETVEDTSYNERLRLLKTTLEQKKKLTDSIGKLSPFITDLGTCKDIVSFLELQNKDLAIIIEDLTNKVKTKKVEKIIINKEVPIHTDTQETLNKT